MNAAELGLLILALDHVGRVLRDSTLSDAVLAPLRKADSALQATIAAAAAEAPPDERPHP